MLQTYTERLEPCQQKNTSVGISTESGLSDVYSDPGERVRFREYVQKMYIVRRGNRARRSPEGRMAQARVGRMGKISYFAYGSNMLTERLRARCPSAVRVGCAEVENFRIEFSKRSMDGSGKATLIRSAEGDDRSYGIVFEVDETEMPELDRVEGAGRGYDIDKEFPVRLLDAGTIVNTRTYLAAEAHSHLKPYDWYLALVIAGALEHNLDQEYIMRLRQCQYEVDVNHDREERRSAVVAMRKAGITDYRELLLNTGHF